MNPVSAAKADQRSSKGACEASVYMRSPSQALLFDKELHSQGFGGIIGHQLFISPQIQRVMRMAFF